MNQDAVGTDVAVAIRGLTKRFPGVIANKDVDLTVRHGEIHALLGENGAGKSTLMSCLCGLYQPEEGEILLASKGSNVQRVEIRSPRHAIRLGIGMVHQHFKLVPTQTVAENVILGFEGLGFFPKMREIEAEVAALGEKYGLTVDPTARIQQLPVGLRQRVEILKLLYRGADTLILDEPTAVLTPQEAAELGDTLRDLAADGKAIIFISHKLDEVLSIADVVTVLRGGSNVATIPTEGATKKQLAELMVGREVLFQAHREPMDAQETLIETKSIHAEDDRGVPALRGVDFEIRSGEILGLAGIAGNGQRELAEALTGLRSVTSGTLELRGTDVTGASARTLIDGGVAHIPADRLKMGLAGGLPLTDNMIMKQYRRPGLANGPFLSNKISREITERYIEWFNVSTPGPTTLAASLSGGNQQKAILAREIDAGETAPNGSPPVIVAVYPTRGLDVGAIESVRGALLEERRKGAAILLISEDLDELMILSDRITVLHGGELMGTMLPQDATQENLGLMMAGERIE